MWILFFEYYCEYYWEYYCEYYCEYYWEYYWEYYCEYYWEYYCEYYCKYCFWNIIENIIENIIVNINSFCNLNIIVNTTLKCYHKQALSKKIKLMGEGGAWNIFRQNYWAMKYLALCSPGIRNFFWKISKNLRPPSPTYLMYAP